MKENLSQDKKDFKKPLILAKNKEENTLTSKKSLNYGSRPTRYIASVTNPSDDIVIAFIG